MCFKKNITNNAKKIRVRYLNIFTIYNPKLALVADAMSFTLVIGTHCRVGSVVVLLGLQFRMIFNPAGLGLIPRDPALIYQCYILLCISGITLPHLCILVVSYLLFMSSTYN